MNQKRIAPSLMAANLLSLGVEQEKIIEAGIDLIHLDIVDNHYAKNLIFGPSTCKALFKNSKVAEIEVHLMTNPTTIELIDEFVLAGARRVIIHPDTCSDVEHIIEHVKAYNCKVGFAFSAEDKLEDFKSYFSYIDMCLVLCVAAGFGGQSFNPASLQMISKLKSDHKNLEIIVDGGLNSSNLAEVSGLGADTFVVGSYFFQGTDYSAKKQEILSYISI